MTIPSNPALRAGLFGEMPVSLEPDACTATAPVSAASSADLLDENEAAHTLSVAVQTLRNWRWKGEGPRFVKLGKRTVRYRRGDLAAFVEAGTTGKAA